MDQEEYRVEDVSKALVEFFCLVPFNGNTFIICLKKYGSPFDFDSSPG